MKSIRIKMMKSIRITMNKTPQILKSLMTFLCVFIFVGSLHKYGLKNFEIVKLKKLQTGLKDVNMDLLVQKMIDLKSNDGPEFVSLLRTYFIEPPSKKPYNLIEMDKSKIEIHGYLHYKKVYASYIFANSILRDLFKGYNSGIFVEAGALDGEFLSNTLFLETHLNWTGLLVEANRASYNDLIKKHRKSWTTPLCLSSTEYSHKTLFSSPCSKNEAGMHILGGSKVIMAQSIDYNVNTGFCFHEVFCVPIYSLLYSLNISRVDFFSLDIEGAEANILRNFPFDKIAVDVWIIEHSKNFVQSSADKINDDHYQDMPFIEFMERNGYYLFDIMCGGIPDYAFIRRDTEIFDKLQVPEAFWKRRNICKRKRMLNSDWIPYLNDIRDRSHYPDIKFKII